MKTWQGVLLGIFLGIAGLALILWLATPPRGEAIVIPATPTLSQIVVYVTGAVNAPGLITLERGSRWNDAIAAAQGFREDAYLSAINLAARVNDGDKLVVPSQADHERELTQVAAVPTIAPGQKHVTNTVTPTPAYPININTASVQLLAQLPGIGETRAAQIADYRQKNGPFKKIEEIQNIPGIGPTTFEKLKPFITVSE